MYKLSGINIDLELLFKTAKQAQAQLEKWVSDDMQEFGEDTRNEYYITEVKTLDHGQDVVRLSGSGNDIRRNVYEDDDGKCYIWFYGKMIEVKRGALGYKTVELY